jgi:Flp pilus assembly protein TadD
MAEQWLLNYAQELDAGIALANERKWLEAVNKYNAAIAISPILSPAFVNRGVAKMNLREHASALEDLNQAILLQPTLAMAYNNRGVVYRSLGQGGLAAQDYLKAIELSGDQAIDAHANLATYYFECKQFELADSYYRKAIELAPDYALTHWNYGMSLLLQGDYSRGWREYHWRWQVPSYRATQTNIDAPLWLGLESLVDKTILLQCEQGFGDMIQFCRYAPLVKVLGGRVVLEVQAGLVELCKSLAGVDDVFAKGDTRLQSLGIDFYCPMMSLPLAFATTLETIPAPKQYLFSNTEKTQDWQKRLGVRTKPRVGVVWSSDPGLAVGNSKTIALQTFAQLLSNQFEFVSLQKNLWYEEQVELSKWGIRHFGEALVDFSDTAALCECLDVVVSVDTSVAHLAGALGKPVCILLHAHADWRWQLAARQSVWYPSARLYRMQDGADWTGVLATVREDLIASLSS